jgi:hypothetical protein
MKVYKNAAEVGSQEFTDIYLEDNPDHDWAIIGAGSEHTGGKYSPVNAMEGYIYTFKVFQYARTNNSDNDVTDMSSDLATGS